MMPSLRFLAFLAFFSFTTVVNAQTPPIADFFVVGGDTAGCENLTVFFQCDVQSTNPIVQYDWDLGGQAGLDSCQVGRIYDQVGAYTITLIVTDNMGFKDTITKINHILIHSNPDISFSVSQVQGCSNLDAQLVNTSTVAGSIIDSSFWLIGVNSYTTPTVNHTINTPGCEQLFLWTSTPEGCTADTTLPNYLCVVPNPNAGFTSSILSACDTSTTVSFINTSTHGSSTTYQWDFGDGDGTSTAQNPTYIYDSFGTFPVTLIVTDPNTNCADTISQNVVINPNNIADFIFSPSGVCPGEAIQFTDQSIGTAISYTWDFGDGNMDFVQNPLHSYASPGCYTVTLSVNFGFGCVSTKTFDCITVSPPPSGSFTRIAGDKTSCNTPHSVTFDATVSGATDFFWDFEGTLTAQNQSTPTHVFNSTGVYPIDLVLISGQGCTTIVTMDTIEIQELIADFASDTTQGCLPVAVNFTNTTTSTSSLTNTHWFFGDGDEFPILANNVSHGYSNTGAYDVTLIVTNSFGCVDTIVKTDYILVGNIPSLSFTANPDPSCVNTPITFTNTSNPNATNFVWDFGNGDTSQAVNPTYTYQDTGTYTITMSAEYNGCPNTVVFVDTIQVLPPIAYFTTDLTCDSLSTVQFINQSAFASSYFWTFGDGDTSSQVNPRHTYAALGSYTVTLTATSSNGCSHTYVDNINLLEPIAAFGDTASQACTPAPANLVTINNSVNASSYSWSVTGGGTFVVGHDSAFAPVLGLDTAGMYDVTLIVTDDRGCMDTITRTICVSDVFINGSEPDTSQLQMNGVTFFCGINGYVDENGNQATDTLECYWTDCTPLTVSFVDSSYSYPDTAISRVWDFGNGDTSHAVNPTYTYNDPSGVGVYLVTLTISNLYGSTATDTVAIIRPSQPITSFELADTIFCVGEDIGIDNNSTGLDISYAWDFGNGDTSTARELAYAYDSIGTYIVSLTTTDMNGCDSTFTRTITVESPSAGFRADTTYSDCAALTVQFADTSSGAVSWLWDFGTGNPADITTLQNPTFTFAVSDTYDIQLVITSIAGCRDTVVQTNLVVVDGPRADYTIAPANGCIDHEVTLAANGVNVAQYIWVTGTVDANTGVPDTIVHVSNASTDTLIWNYTVDSIFNTELLVIDPFGCTRNYALSTPVRTTEPIAMFSIDTTDGCAPLVIQTLESSNDAFLYNWRVPGATISNSNASSPTITFPNGGIYDTIELIITDIYGCQDTMTLTDNISVSEVFAGFSPDTTVGCAPLTINFTDTSSTFLGSLTQWDWNFGDGTSFTDTTQNISYTYPNAPIGHGTRTAFLTVTNDLGCVDTEAITIVPSKPIAYFEVSDTFVCTTQNLNFTNFSTGRNITYAWDFGDGNTSTLRNPSHNYATEDSFNVCLTVTDENGCDSAFCRLIVVGDPVANFGADVTYTSCPPLITGFTDSSVYAVSWQWDLGNGSIPTIQNPVTVYSVPDSFDVTLIVTSQSGCRDTLTRTNYIVIDGPLGTFDYSPLEGCQPFEVDFVVTAELANIGSIDFGDGQVIPIPGINTFTATDTFRYTKIYTLPGNYLPKLSLTDGNGCTRILSNTADTVRVTDPRARFTVDNTGDCFPFTVTTNSDSSTYVNSYQWFAPDAMPSSSTIANPTFSYNFATTDTITLVITDIYGCTDTMQQEIISSGITSIGNVSADVGCPTLSVNFTNNSITSHGVITDYLWNFGDGNTSTTSSSSNIYDTVGTFIVTLTTTNSVGCTSTAVIDTINIFPNPIANFITSDTSVCVGQAVSFTNLTNGSSPTYVWDFGDGNTDTTTNPVYAFSTEGTFNVCLTVVDQLGCQDVICKEIIVANPVANFIATSTYEACPPATFTFNNNSVNEVSYQWYVYNSDSIAVDSSDLEIPSFTLTIPDLYDVELIVTSASGCTDTMFREDYLWLDGPIGAYSVSPIVGCEPLDVDFTIETTSVDEFVIMYGNGDSSVHDITTAPNIEIVTYTYSAGTFVPTLILRDSAGCERILTMDTVTITPFNIDFLANDTLLCENGTIQFSSQLLTTLPIDSVLWRFEGADILTSTQLNPSIPYSMVGDYDVTLIVGNGFCLDSLTKTDFIKIAPNPITAFVATPDSTCVPQTVTFTDGSSIFSGTIDSLFWDFDHMGATDTNVTTTTHLYDVADTFNVTLTTISNFGCTSSLTQSVVVYPLPIPDFTMSDTFVCTGQAILFNNLSTGSNTTYVWNFGDGNTDTTTNPVYAFATEDTFNICLTAIDQFGCQDVICKEIIVANPLANFAADTTYGPCIVQDINFIDQSVNAVSWHWSFGDGDTSILQNPLHTYQEPGIYTVTLVVTSQSGCADTLVMNDYITIDGPSGSFSFVPLTGCVPQDVDFTGIADSTVQYTWFFGNGDSLVNTNITGTDLATYNYQVGGVYYPTLRIEDSKGCFVILNSPDSIRVDELSIDFDSDNQIICTQGFVNFNSIITSNQTIDSVSWMLSGATNPQSTALNPANVFYNTLGTYDVTLIVHSGYCSDTITKVDFIRVAPTPVASYTYQPTPICTDVPFNFTDSSSILTGSISTWDWSDGLAYNDANQTPFPYTATVTGNINLTLTVTSDYGCVDDTTRIITVFQTPTADAGPDQHICINDIAYLNGSGGDFYQWTPAASLTCDTCPNPIANPLTPTTYQLMVTTVDGCTDTDLMYLDVGPFALPYIGLNNDTITICEGETTQLFASGGVDITSYIWDSTDVGLSCYTHCLNPFASPTVTTTYHVQVTGIGGCVNYDSITVVVVTDNGALAGSDVTICEGDSYQLSTAFGNNPIWSPQAELSCTFCPNPIATPSETTTYTVTVSGANGCIITDTITVYVQSIGFANAGADKVICAGDSAQIEAEGSGTINWTPQDDLDNPIIFNPIATPNQTTTYTATITNDLCVITDSMTVFVETQASISGTDTTICLGDAAQLSITGLAQEAIWTPAESLSNPNSFNPIAFPNETTVYQVVGTLEGCENDTTFVTVFVENAPDIGMLPNITIVPGQSVPLADGPIEYSYLWSPNIDISCLDCPRPFVEPDTTTTYSVVYQTAIGCENTASVNVIVQNICDETLIDLPQAFSPNGDNLNDIFYVRSTALETVLEYRIYNQWGEEMFSSGNFSPNDPDTGWDGTYNGQAVNQGVYIYQVTAKCPITESVILKKGNFMLIR